MQDYTVNWADGHKPHADPASDNCVFSKLDGAGSGAGDCGDGDIELGRCCGTNRLGAVAPLVVDASTGRMLQFVTM